MSAGDTDRPISKVAKATIVTLGSVAIAAAISLFFKDWMRPYVLLTSIPHQYLIYSQVIGGVSGAAMGFSIWRAKPTNWSGAIALPLMFGGAGAAYFNFMIWTAVEIASFNQVAGPIQTALYPAKKVDIYRGIGRVEIDPFNTGEAALINTDAGVLRGYELLKASYPTREICAEVLVQSNGRGSVRMLNDHAIISPHGLRLAACYPPSHQRDPLRSWSEITAEGSTVPVLPQPQVLDLKNLSSLGRQN